MSRSFRDLVEALKSKEEKSELKPRAKGEQDFAASQGYPPKIGGSDDRPYPEKGSDDVVNARKMTKTKMHDNPVPGNETGKQPIQGSSQSPQLKTYRDVIAGLKQTTGGRGYQLDNGDKKIVRSSPTSVKGTDDLSENITIGRAQHAGGGHLHHNLMKDGKKVGTLSVAPDDTQTLITKNDPGVPHSKEMWGHEVQLQGHQMATVDHMGTDEHGNPNSIPADHPIAKMISEEELDAGGAAHKKLVRSMIDHTTRSHEEIGYQKHRITQNNGDIYTVHTNSYGTSTIKRKDERSGKVSTSKIKHNLKKLVKDGLGQPTRSRDLDESVQDQLSYIAETSKPAMVTFNNGETATVNPQTAHKMLETSSRLNATNARRFNESINESSDGFLKMMQFSEKH